MQLNIWHKEMNYRVRRMNQREEDMYRALLKLTLTKKKIKNSHEGEKRDHHVQRKWARSKRRQRRNDKDIESTLLLQQPLRFPALSQSVLGAEEATTDVDAIEEVQQANFRGDDTLLLLPPPSHHSHQQEQQQQQLASSPTASTHGFEEFSVFQPNKYRRLKKLPPLLPPGGSVQTIAYDPSGMTYPRGGEEHGHVAAGGDYGNMRRRRKRRKTEKERDWNVSSIQVSEVLFCARV